MDAIFSSPYLPYVVVAVVLVVGYQQFASRVSVRVPGVGLSMDDVLAKLLGPRYAEAQVQKAAVKQQRLGNHLGAGRIYEEAGKLQQAADAYAEGSELFAAASVYEKMGKLERSAEMYLQAGDYKKAAQVFVTANRPAKAAGLFYEKGNTLEAARLYGIAGEWGKAGDLYAKSGYPLRAAEAYEKKGELVKAAECYEKHFMENVSYATTYSATAVSADQKSALMAGQLYERAGDLNRALQAYSRGNYFKEAGRASMGLKQFAKAAEYYMRAEDPESAASAFDSAGDKLKAANLRGELALKQERVAEAAKYFKEAQDYLRAAELFESVQMLAEAAGAYEAGDSHSAAGSVYIRAGLKDRAAAAYERGGELETAAKLYEEVGNAKKAVELYGRVGLTFKSGEAAAKAGEREKAIALLQRVGASDENYRAATELLADLFIQSRMPGLAVERLQKALAGQAVSALNLDLHYWLAKAYETSGNAKDALAVYKKVLSEDLQYKDVSQRVTQLQSGAAPAAAEDRFAPTRREMHERGIATLQVCPTCGLCYDHQAQSCTSDQSPLKAPRVVPYTLLERYRLVKMLGEGGMGMVLQAHDRKLDRQVAIKILNAEEFVDPAMRTRLDREAKAVARINHPGVIGIYDTGELEDGSAFLVMELLEGCDVGRLIKHFGRGTPPQVASLLRQVCSAVAAAHRAGIVHRDLKPQNVFLVNSAAGFVAKVLDFGIAKSTSVDPGVTRTGTILGTPAYMSPEQIQGPNVDARSDLYSLATMGFEALSGQRLVSEGEVLRMLYAVTNTPAPPLSSVLPGAPALVDEAFSRALAKDPAARPADVESWLVSFVDLLEKMPSEAKGWPVPVPTTLPRIQRPSPSPPASRGAAAEPTGAVPAAPQHPTLLAHAPTAAVGAPAPAAAAKPPRFVAQDELGRGRLGTVFRALDQGDGRSVALRVLPVALLKPDLLPAVVADLKAASQLSHPNVVKLLGLVDVGGNRCVVTELVQGRNFAQALTSGHKMTFQQVHGLGRVVAAGLAYIHSRGLVHGSIQPSNIMVVSGVVKLADQGLGRLAHAAASDLDYRAPEAQLDVSGDLYGLAAVLYHLLTGVHPKSGAQGAAQPLPSTLAAGVPEAFDKLLLRCLHPRVELRLGSAEEILRELKDMVHFG